MPVSTEPLRFLQQRCGGWPFTSSKFENSKQNGGQNLPLGQHRAVPAPLAPVREALGPPPHTCSAWISRQQGGADACAELSEGCRRVVARGHAGARGVGPGRWRAGGRVLCAWRACSPQDQPGIAAKLLGFHLQVTVNRDGLDLCADLIPFSSDSPCSPTAPRPLRAAWIWPHFTFQGTIVLSTTERMARVRNFISPFLPTSENTPGNPALRGSSHTSMFGSTPERAYYLQMSKRHRE